MVKQTKNLMSLILSVLFLAAVAGAVIYAVAPDGPGPIQVDPQLYDEYAGHYRDEVQRPDLEMIVRNEGGRLTVESAGQKVELFPTSETEFFVKQFYGEATFIRDADGRVAVVDFAMPDYNTRKRSIQHAKRVVP